jgi:tetrahydromethanopterin S-methyltransferase subunit B
MIDVSNIRDDIERCESRVRDLQHQTVEYVAFQPSGKIVITDKPALESTNNEIDRLRELARNNAAVLDKLTEALQDYPTVDSIRKKKAGLEDQVTRTTNLLRIDIGDLVKTHFDVDPSSPFDHPEGKKLKEKADASLAVVAPLLEAVTTLLAQAEDILSQFQPSGAQAMPNREQFTGITRAKTGGMA